MRNLIRHLISKLKEKVGFIAVFFLTCSVILAQVPSQTTNPVVGLEGAYEFVSKTSTFSQPAVTKEVLSINNWKGLWIFCNGYFSRAIARKRTDAKLNIGEAVIMEDYRSSSGSYQIESDFISFSFPLSQSIISIRPEVARFRINGDILTLKQIFDPNTHSNVKGEIITVLRRLSVNQPENLTK